MITVERGFQLGGESSFEVRDAAGFFARVIADRRMQRLGGDCQGIGYSVETEADARAIGAEDTVGGLVPLGPRSRDRCPRGAVVSAPYACSGSVVGVVEIKNRWTGAVIATGREGETVRDVVVRIVGEKGSLESANLARAYLEGANFESADLAGADDFRGANLARANMPDGRNWEDYSTDPLAGICTEPEARKRAIGAWGNHEWANCPMHAAHGWGSFTDAPEDKRRDVAAFVAVFDARLLRAPVTPTDPVTRPKGEKT